MRLRRLLLVLGLLESIEASGQLLSEPVMSEEVGTHGGSEQVGEVRRPSMDPGRDLGGRAAGENPHGKPGGPINPTATATPNEANRAGPPAQSNPLDQGVHPTGIAPPSAYPAASGRAPTPNQNVSTSEAARLSRQDPPVVAGRLVDAAGIASLSKKIEDKQEEIKAITDAKDGGTSQDGEDAEDGKDGKAGGDGDGGGGKGGGGGGGGGDNSKADDEDDSKKIEGKGSDRSVLQMYDYSLPPPLPPVPLYPHAPYTYVAPRPLHAPPPYFVPPVRDPHLFPFPHAPYSRRFPYHMRPYRQNSVMNPMFYPPRYGFFR